MSFDFFNGISKEDLESLELNLDEDEEIDSIKEIPSSKTEDDLIDEALSLIGTTRDSIDSEQLDELIDSEIMQQAFDQILEAEKKFDVKVSRRRKEGKPFVELIPAEEFRIKERSKSIEESDFVAHITNKTIGEMIELGFKEDDLIDLSQSRKFDNNELVDARYSDPEEEERVAISTKFEQLVEVIEAYVTLFDEDDKRNKIYHIIQVGHKVLKHEEVCFIPFINISPIMMPNKFVGVAAADLGTDIQEIRSKLFREILNNASLANTGRYEVVEGQVNLQDLIDNKIGGIVRTKSQGALKQLQTPQLSSATFPLLQQMEQEREERAGVSRMTQGLDSNALTSNTAATSVNQIMTAAQQKILLIARVYAETGVKKLFWQLYETIRTHQNKEDFVKLSGKFVNVNPFDWKDRYDMTVTVGLGNGNKDQQAYHLQQIIQSMQQVANNPKTAHLITDKHIFNAFSELTNNSGYRDTETFIANPNDPSVVAPEPTPSPEMVEAQGKAQKDQADAQLKQAQTKVQLVEAQNKQLQIELDKRQLELDIAKFEWEKKVNASEVILEANQNRPVGIDTGK